MYELQICRHFFGDKEAQSLAQGGKNTKAAKWDTLVLKEEISIYACLVLKEAQTTYGFQKHHVSILSG